MRSISDAVTRKDLVDKASGIAQYADDFPRVGILCARLISSTQANAAFSVTYPPLPEGYFIADHRDVPVNVADLHSLDMPVFAVDRVRFKGEVIAIIAGPNKDILDRLVQETEITYSDEHPIMIEISPSSETMFDFPLRKGDPDAAFSQADFIYEETFYTGLQEQAYLEPQALEAHNKNGVLTIIGSMQCPYYIVGALKRAFHLNDHQVRVVQAVTGGGFGGKEEYPSLLSCQVAAIALKSGKPCRVVLGRREDIAITTKRHPAIITLRAAVREGHVLSIDADIRLDGGAYQGLSDVVLQRAMFCCTGVYNIEHVKVHGRVFMTHTPPKGAFRGFGAPQSFFAIETFMSHLAAKLGKDAIAFKKAHFVRQGDQTVTSGIYHEAPPIQGMLEKILSMSGYEKKRAAYREETGYLRHGIGLSLIFHGCGFTGNGERDIIRARIKLQKDLDGSVRILASNTEIGQGLATTFPKVVANTLGIPLEKVHYNQPDTAVSPDSGPTVASRSMMVVGRLLQRAAQRLKDQWQEGKMQVVEERYVDPPHRIPFDMETFTGDAYPAFSWAINVVEVEMDIRTAQSRILNAYAVFDCGTPIDFNVLRGQAEGGIAQGLGFASMEYMDIGLDGAIQQNSFTDYMIPTAKDTPAYHVAFWDDPYYDGPFGGRGAGELTLVGAAPAYVAAVEQALGVHANHIPLTPEILMAMDPEVKWYK